MDQRRELAAPAEKPVKKTTGPAAKRASRDRAGAMSGPNPPFGQGQPLASGKNLVKFNRFGRSPGKSHLTFFQQINIYIFSNV